MDETPRLEVPRPAAQNGGMVTEVGIEELRADLKRFLQIAQSGYELQIKEDGKVIARLAPPEDAPLQITPAKISPRELAKLPGISVPGITVKEIDEALEWTRSDRFEILPDE